MEPKPTVSKEIVCSLCHVTYEFSEPEGYTGTDFMPDGYLVNGAWICDRCGSCPACGRTLEKEPQKRGVHPEPCRYCDGTLANN